MESESASETPNPWRNSEIASWASCEDWSLGRGAGLVGGDASRGWKWRGFSFGRRREWDLNGILWEEGGCWGRNNGLKRRFCGDDSESGKNWENMCVLCRPELSLLLSPGGTLEVKEQRHQSRGEWVYIRALIYIFFFLLNYIHTLKYIYIYI